MNFTEYQEQAKRQTKRLILFYFLAVFGVFAAIHTIVAGIYGSANSDSLAAAWFNPGIFFIDALVVFAVIGGGTLYRMSQLRNMDGDDIAQCMGGTQVPPQTTDFKERRLLNIVEEMAIASGVKVPNVYILKDEKSINAFAAGWTPETSVVAVTQGTLDYLNRDELQGVVGHEFSHILNQDTALNLKLIGVLFGLGLVAIIGVGLIRAGWSVFLISNLTSSDDDDDNNSGQAVGGGMMGIGLALLLIGLLGQILSHIIQMAISRQREFLADASSVQFTRNPMGLASALKKIGSPKLGSAVASKNAVEASHMFFGSVFSEGFFSHLFDSHPDLTTRIKRIEPQFDGYFPQEVAPCNQNAIDEEEKHQRQINAVHYSDGGNSAPFAPSASYPSSIPQSNGSSIANLSGTNFPQKTAPLSFNQTNLNENTGIYSLSSTDSALPPSSGTSRGTASSPFSSFTPAPPAVPRFSPAPSMINHLGNLTGRKLKIADALLEKVPPQIALSIRQPMGAAAALFAVLLDKNPAVRQKQMAIITSKLNPGIVTEVKNIGQLLLKHSNSVKILIVQMALPVLQTLSKTNYLVCRPVLSELIKADGRIDILEFTIIGYVIRNLDRQFALSQVPVPKINEIKPLVNPFRVVVSCVAYSGNNQPEGIYKAYGEAMSVFGLNAPILSKSEISIQSFMTSLSALTQASLLLRNQILAALYRCAAADGVITEREGELIRVAAAQLECPMPVWEDLAANSR